MLKAGDFITLPPFLGSAKVELIDEYRPGIWQVKAQDTGAQFLVSNHILKDDDLDELDDLLDSVSPVAPFRGLPPVCQLDDCGCSGEAHP